LRASRRSKRFNGRWTSPTAAPAPRPLAPPTAGEDTSNPDSDDPSEVAVALDEADDGLADAIESALAGRSAIVAVGVPTCASPRYSPRERTRGGTWRVACRPGVADALGRAFVLGTAVAEAVAEGAIELRTVADEPDVQRILFASPDRIDAVVGPEKDRTLVPRRRRNESRPRAERCASGSRRRRPRPSMPARSRLLAAACETLDDRFADDVAAVLDALPYGAVGRTGEVTDRTLLVALAARHDHLLWDLRRWIGDGADGERRRRRDRRWTGPHRRPASPRAARPDRGDQDARGRRPPASSGSGRSTTRCSARRQKRCSACSAGGSRSRSTRTGGSDSRPAATSGDRSGSGRDVTRTNSRQRPRTGMPNFSDRVERISISGIREVFEAAGDDAINRARPARLPDARTTRGRRRSMPSKPGRPTPTPKIRALGRFARRSPKTPDGSGDRPRPE